MAEREARGATGRIRQRLGRLAGALRRTSNDRDPNRPYIVAIIPAHNEADCIADTLEGLLAETRQPDRIVVAADNCDDDTANIARSFDGVTVFETVDNKHRKVGALTQAWQAYGRDADFVLGVDADTVLSPESVEVLEAEMLENPAIGGLMARYTFDQDLATGPFSALLVRLQRMEFAGWTMDILRRGRRTYVLGGQATLFRGEALREVTERNKRSGPWSTSSQVEDMELTWRLEELGWETLCSEHARAYVGPMVTLRAFWAQRRKWDAGTIQILLSNGFSKQTSYPWRMQFKTVLDASIRVLFLVLLALALQRDSFVWSWVWAIPPLLAIVLNLRTAWSIPNRRAGDLFLAGTLVAFEAYLVFRLCTWFVSWVAVLRGSRRDGWSAQYRAEGKG